MANGFNSGTYEIYWHKQQDGTPNAPQSPTTSTAQSPTDKNAIVRKGAVIGIAAMAAKRVISTLRTEIVATTGNEILQNDINNIITGVGITAGVVAGGLPVVAGIAISAGTSEIVRRRSVTRQNRAIEYDNKLRGARVRYGQGGVY